MGSIGYQLGVGFGRFVFRQTVRCHVLRPAAVDRSGPFILALTHLSHTDPFLLSIWCRRRQIDWLARIEFWKYGASARLMETMNAIPVRRFGLSPNAVRTSVQRLRQGRVVGICPEAGVAQGMRSAMRAGPMKRGVCLIARRANVPVLPCVMLGTDKLNRPAPWIPPLRARLWVGFGSRLLYPDVANPDWHDACEAMIHQLSAEYQRLFAEVKDAFDLSDADIP